MSKYDYQYTGNGGGCLSMIMAFIPVIIAIGVVFVLFGPVLAELIP